ncbi:MAG TPA: histidinol dehydrogenase [Solirubrobacterales bacterium]|nr:histidinol dehydrogenase [Solirubrobacterales bacterium]
MRQRRFQWQGAAETAAEIRGWTAEVATPVDVTPIEREIRGGGDEALMRLTERFDATEQAPASLRIGPEEAEEALAGIETELRESLQVAAANIRAVAEAQLRSGTQELTLPQGQRVTVGEVPVGAAGVYAPGGRAAYPSSVLMGCIPARVAGVERLALATPPGARGRVDPIVLAAAALCGVDAVHPIGGAQAIFALAYGTESVQPVDVIAGPGNAWVREAKRAAYGRVGIDSLAGPSELMLIADAETDPQWAALDLCAQAEHGGDGPLIVASAEDDVLEAIWEATATAVAERSGIGDAPLALLQLPDNGLAAIELANAFAPEHLELLAREAVERAALARTAGCVFLGPRSATAFGDYAAGSNHILPTGGAGRFSGPLSPAAFRRPTAAVEVSAEAAAKLAPHVETLARAEGFPVHGESAMIRR